jgi:cyclic-di-GMP-binding biofilm dispersal mediator protein
VPERRTVSRSITSGSGVPGAVRRVSLPSVGLDLAGRSVLVVGATGGLGLPIAWRLAARGALLTVSARPSARLDAVAAELGAVAAPADLTYPDAAARVVAAAVEAHGQLDGVVHAAGVVAFGPAVEVDDDTLDRLVALNLLAPVRLLRAAFPHLAASASQGGEPFVVNVSAVVAEQPTAGMAAYSATKAALAAFDAAAARELRRSRIRLVDVRPPHTETGLAARSIAGRAPALPPGLEPDAVADRVLAAIEAGERDVPAAAFG